MNDKTPTFQPELFLQGNLQRSISDLLEQLIRIPSRAGIDPCEKIFSLLAKWLGAYDVHCSELKDHEGRVVALAGYVKGSPKASAYVLNATVDTAGFGDPAAWSKNPLSAETAAGWLHGRGSADAKAGVAIFCHLVVAFRARELAHGLGFVFDADEHTGQFRGMRSFLDHCQGQIAGALIGYPGNDQIGVGARGFWRATLQVYGMSAHSGSSRGRGVNAITKVSHLISLIDKLSAEVANNTDAFPLPPKFTVTGIRGGGEFSSVPDRCELDLDVRVTPAFTADIAEDRVRSLIEQIDARWPSWRNSQVLARGALPAYILDSRSPLVAALTSASDLILGRRLPLAVTGPSNVGNLLAERGIAATCGFGVSYRNIHAPDECVELSSVAPVFRVYERALEQLLGIASERANRTVERD